MLRTYQLKLYLSNNQRQLLRKWLGSCCWLYNQALEQRRKTYEETGKGLSYMTQTKWLTTLRNTDELLGRVPVTFARSSLRRLDNAMQAFFRRCKGGKKPGYPRFQPGSRFVSMTHMEAATHVTTRGVRIPGIGWVQARGRWQQGTQKQLRLIYKAGTWYAEVLVDVAAMPIVASERMAVGIDLGLTHLATLNNGEAFDNPRWLKLDSRQRRRVNKRFSRGQKASNNRKRALFKLQKLEARTAARRKSHLHKFTTDLVRKYGFIALEDLDIKALAQSRLSKSIFDVGWGIFKQQLTYKAECAGTQLVFVDPAYTSQTCPECGAVKAKELKERIHDCPCGCYLDRDVAAAMVILSRAQAVGLAAA